MDLLTLQDAGPEAKLTARVSQRTNHEPKAPQVKESFRSAASARASKMCESLYASSSEPNTDSLDASKGTNQYNALPE